MEILRTAEEIETFRRKHPMNFLYFGSEQ